MDVYRVNQRWKLDEVKVMAMRSCDFCKNENEIDNELEDSYSNVFICKKCLNWKCENK